jgi:hypothetical protein
MNKISRFRTTLLLAATALCAVCVHAQVPINAANTWSDSIRRLLAKPEFDLARSSCKSETRRPGLLNVGLFSAGDKSIKGAGTIGRIPKFTDVDLIADSVITELNGNIGIGTTTPGSKLTVFGRIEAFNTGISAGVLGQSVAGAGVRGNSDTGAGVFGSSDTGFGTRGLSNNNYGVFGLSLNNVGVVGQSESSSGTGVLGVNTHTSGTGVLGQAFNGTGIRGVSSTGFGVFGSSETFTAVEARSNTGFGIFGSSNTNTAIHGQSNGGTGVFGSSDDSNHAGVHAFNSGGGTALLAESANGAGVIGVSAIDFGAGVAGQNISIGPNGVGVTGQANNGLGVFGVSNTGVAVLGQTSEGTGVLGFGNAGLAGHFVGDVSVSGSITKGGGSFKIDHPLDPANKYLSHSFVESPDMMNIYNGNVALDQNGEAIVALPEWFQALNQDFRYSLTAIGAPAPGLYIAEEVSNNKFKIAGGAPGMRVSWHVTGIRQDPYANKHRIKVEEEKPELERGHYLHPDLYSQPEEKGVDWARNPRLMQHMKEMRKKR